MARRYRGGHGYEYDYGWRAYVPSAVRRLQAQRAVQRFRKAGRDLSPVEVAGRRIATTFWGAAWCDNLERYSDFANRLPRGRTYVRGGRVIDLRIAAGDVMALVSGTDIYEVKIAVAPVPADRWRRICQACAGGIDSLVELLQGRFSEAVMARLCAEGTGLFPTPREITFTCSCPDWASMCKHVAAVLYGVGARLDRQPELLFLLRQVDGQDLLAGAGAVPLAGKGPRAGRVLATEDLAGVFGVEMAPAPQSKIPAPKGAARRSRDAPVSAAPPEAVAARSVPARRARPSDRSVAASRQTRSGGAEPAPGKARLPAKTRR